VAGPPGLIQRGPSSGRSQERLDGYFLDPSEVSSQLADAGFTHIAKLERQPDPEVEYPSRRCYLLAKRR